MQSLRYVGAMVIWFRLFNGMEKKIVNLWKLLLLLLHTYYILIQKYLIGVEFYGDPHLMLVNKKIELKVKVKIGISLSMVEQGNTHSNPNIHSTTVMILM